MPPPLIISVTANEVSEFVEDKGVKFINKVGALRKSYAGSKQDSKPESRLIYFESYGGKTYCTANQNKDPPCKRYSTSGQCDQEVKFDHSDCDGEFPHLVDYAKFKAIRLGPGMGLHSNLRYDDDFRSSCRIWRDRWKTMGVGSKANPSIREILRAVGSAVTSPGELLLELPFLIMDYKQEALESAPICYYPHCKMFGMYESGKLDSQNHKQYVARCSVAACFIKTGDFVGGTPNDSAFIVYTRENNEWVHDPEGSNWEGRYNNLMYKYGWWLHADGSLEVKMNTALGMNCDTAGFCHKAPGPFEKNVLYYVMHVLSQDDSDTHTDTARIFNSTLYIYANGQPVGKTTERKFLPRIIYSNILDVDRFHMYDGVIIRPPQSLDLVALQHYDYALTDLHTRMMASNYTI